MELLAIKRRIVGVVYRHLYLQTKDLMRLFDITYWPLIDILLWGFGNYVMTKGTNLAALAITNILCLYFWQVTYRANLEITTNLLEEIWERNFVNLFCTPLRFWEWVVSLQIVGLVRIAIMMFICSIAVYWVFDVAILSIPIPILTSFIILLFLSGYGTGFLSASLVLLFGRKAQSLPWMIAWLWAPFVGVFYPVEALPMYMQSISACIPMTYIFSAIRYYAQHNQPLMAQALFYGSLLTVLYIVVGYCLFYRCFQRCKMLGLNRLE
jgi:ABC-2 type transport system permease protein